MISIIGFYLALFVVTFLLGSIPWGVIISRVVYGRDLRNEGSGNIGATNALRTLGKKGGAAVFLLDFGKGLLSGYLGCIAGTYMVNTNTFTAQSLAYTQIKAALGGSFLYAYGIALAVAFAGCVLGHIFSPWLKFHGGKGIAVSVGALFFVFGPWWTLVELAVFVLVVALSKYVSAGSLAAAVLACIIPWKHFWGNWWACGICTLVALVIIFAHHENIDRLINGTENKLGKKVKVQVHVVDAEDDAGDNA